MTADAAYLELLHRAREHTLLGSCATLLEWDEDVSMPEGGAEHRAEQQALMARLLHAQATDPRLGDLLAEAEAKQGSRLAPGDPVAVNLRELREEYEKARLVPGSLVEDLARVTTLSYEAWRAARERRDARVFLPWLGRVVALKQAEADCLARGWDRYDVLLDEWEPDLRWATLGPMLARLREATGPLLDGAIERAGPLPGFLTHPVDVRLQAEVARELAEWLGFDFTSGRLDEAMHPSTIRVGPGDVRLTTRFRPAAFTSGLFTTLHELGHGLYEQFLPGEHFGAPVGEAPSLGLHESQGRLLENHLGRSRPFWQHLWPSLAPRFGAVFRDIVADDVWRAVNHPRRAADRISADELSYDLHIHVRVDLERALVGGTLAASDLPGAWADGYRRLLGVTPPDDLAGCLQDSHWAEGMFGFFPTYTIGNAIAAQLMARLRSDTPALDAALAAGDAEPLLAFLRERVHRLGSLFSTRELVQRATGAPLSIEPLVAHLTAKAALWA
ncbi:MAG TPA: carboxypeptidase M32 [Methylomirabilota bacterium]|jgi:carboxypeptidase Taq